MQIPSTYVKSQVEGLGEMVQMSKVFTVHNHKEQNKSAVPMERAGHGHACAITPVLWSVEAGGLLKFAGRQTSFS